MSFLLIVIICLIVFLFMLAIVEGFFEKWSDVSASLVGILILGGIGSCEIGQERDECYEKAGADKEKQAVCFDYYWGRKK